MDRQGNTVDYIDFTASRTKADFVQLVRRRGSRRRARSACSKQNRMRVNYYEAATPEVARRLFLAGVDFPLVDDVALFLPVARELGIQPLQH